MSRQPFYEVIQPSDVHVPSGYVHGIRSGNTIYIAGQVGRNEKGELVVGDASAQARQAYANLYKILKAAGADWHNVVKITTYLIDRADNATVRAVRLEAMGGHLVPHTGVIVEGLANPDLWLEVEAIAVLPE